MSGTCKNRLIKEILKKTGVDVDVFKGHFTRSASTSKACLSDISVDDILSVTNKCFQRSNFFRKGHLTSLVVRRFKQRTGDWAPV